MTDAPEPTETEKKLLSALHGLSVQVAKLARDVRSVQRALEPDEHGPTEVAFDLNGLLREIGEKKR